VTTVALVGVKGMTIYTPEQRSMDILPLPAFQGGNPRYECSPNVTKSIPAQGIQQAKNVLVLPNPQLLENR